MSEHVQREDALVTVIWAVTVELLGQGGTDPVNLIESDICVLGRGVTRAGAAPIDPVERVLKGQAMAPTAARDTIVGTGMGEVVRVGAAALAARGRG